MPVVGSGSVSHEDILNEVGLPTSSNSLDQEIRTSSGIRQYKVNGVWKNCNMCSPALPQDTPPFSISDWYNYDHNIQSVNGVTISGDLTVDSGQTVTYTATLLGSVTVGSIITWYKFDNGVWSNALGTGASITITWVKPDNAILRASVYSPCSATTFVKDEIVTWNCTPITDGFVWGQETNLYTGTEYTYSCTIQAGTANNSLQFEIDSYGVNFVITQKNIAWDAGAGQYYVNIKIIGYTPQHVGLVVRLKNYCTSSWYTVPTKDLYFINPPTTDTNDARTATLCKTCPSGYTGTCKSVTRAAGIFTGANKTEANNLRDIDMQNEVNNDNTMYCSSDTTGNDQQSGWFQKQCSAGYTGSNHEYVVVANTYFATNKADANTLALNDVNANGQNYANTVGTCTADGGGCVSPNITGFTYLNVNGIHTSAIPSGVSVSISPSAGISGSNLSYSWTLDSVVIATTRDFSYTFNFSWNGDSKTLRLTISNGCGSTFKDFTITPKIFYSHAISQTFTKNNCAQGTGNPYTYSLPIGWSTGLNQATVDAEADNEVANNGQNMANTYGTCTYVPTDPCENLNIPTPALSNTVLKSDFNNIRSYDFYFSNIPNEAYVTYEAYWYHSGSPALVCSSESDSLILSDGVLPLSINKYKNNSIYCVWHHMTVRYAIYITSTSSWCYGPGLVIQGLFS